MPRKMIDISGQTFGELTAICPTKERDSSKAIIWECKCSCGSIFKASNKSLRYGKTTNCGCKTAINNKKDKTGKTFGLLTAIEELQERTPSGLIQYKCKCQCGNEIVATSSALSRGKSSCGCVTNRSAGEIAIERLLVDNSITFAIEHTFSDLRSEKGGVLRFDFVVFSDNKISHLIEFDGEQHFKEVSIFSDTLESRQHRDELKNEYCKRNGIRLIRIRYDEEITIDKLL